MPYGGSVWVVLAFPAAFILGRAKFRSILTLPLPEYRVTSLPARPPCPFSSSLQTPSSLTSAAAASRWEADHSCLPVVWGVCC